MQKIHRGSDIESIITIDGGAISGYANVYVLVVSREDRTFKRMSLYEEGGFIDGDITVLDDTAGQIKVKLHRSETSRLRDYGNYYYQVFISQTQAGWKDSQMIRSDSELGFELVHSFESTSDDSGVEVTPGYGGIEEAPDDGKEYVRKNEAWAENTGGSGVPEAPIDGKQYARKDATWEEVAGGGTSDDVSNESLVPGSTVTDALNELASGQPSNPTYTGTPDLDVGGFEQGVLYENLDMQAFGDQLLSFEYFPTLTNPNLSLSDNSPSYREIGEVFGMTINATFNRGSISPAYGTSGNRSGLPSQYVYLHTNTGASHTENTTSLTDSHTFSNVTVEAGGNNVDVDVNYDGGEQPLSSKGNPYSTPLPAGNIIKSIAFQGVYPYFATTSSITSTTKQALTSMTSNITVSMVAESGGNKQTLEVPQAWKNFSKLEQFNTLSGQWDTIDFGSFTKTTTTKSVQGNTVNYDVYTHNGGTILDRQLRFS